MNLQQQLVALTSTKFSIVHELSIVTKQAKAAKPKVRYGRKEVDYKLYVRFPLYDESEKIRLYQEVSRLQKRLYDVEETIRLLKTELAKEK